MWDRGKLEFSPLQPGDFGLLHRWLNAGPARRWYNKGPRSMSQIESNYLPRVRGKEPTSCYIIRYAGTPVGHIQTYMIADYPDYARHVELPEGTAGLDIFIGEESFIHQGLGPVILDEFLRRIVFADPHVSRCVVGPEPDNEVAIRAYAKAGFRYLKTIQVPSEAEPEHLMVIERNEEARWK